jgi:hypothetical protein
MLRTTVLLDSSAQAAAKALAARLNVSPSEAMRRALIHYKQTICGVSAFDRKKKREILGTLIELSAGLDPLEEVRQRKREDGDW